MKRERREVAWRKRRFAWSQPWSSILIVAENQKRR
jgi:hypothetical protein